MLTSLWRRFGRRATHSAIRSQAREGGFLDVGLGFALLKDRRVSWKTKLLALLLGAGILGLLVLLELPVETIIAGLLPALGVMMDVTIDGLEFVAGPILFAVLLLPHLAPKPLVQQIRAERAGFPQVPALPA
ncbi:MAG TPA: hypothetical protein VKU00_25025 [Chthonomonadaceae bacterium]|nr:hypothetical protein [Chthonomonadaceae bacterium]